jgi:hypothetical protein
MTFHVVCHDCDFEDLWGTELEAEDDVGDHEELTGHDVEYGQID